MKMPKLLKKKEKEEKKQEKQKNIPLFFLHTFDSLAHLHIPGKRRLFYYPAVFIALYCILVIFARQIETIATFPISLSSGEEVFGITPPHLGGQSFLIPGENSTVISGVFIDNKSTKTIFYFHGNGAPLPYYASDIAFFSKLGYNVMSYDYPGYGKSTGFPYEENIYKASEQFYTYIKQLKNLKDENIVIVGHSVGTAPALKFASEQKVHSVILLAPFLSRYNLALSNYGWIPQKLFFLPNSFIIDSEIQSIHVPILYIHGNEDNLIPISQSKELYRINGENAFYVELDNQGHNNIIDNHTNLLSLVFASFIENGKLAESFYFINKKTEKAFLTPLSSTGSTGSIQAIQKNIFAPVQEQEKSVETKDALQSSFHLPEGYVNSFDLDSDDSFTKYVNPYVGYTTPSYVPSGLVPVESTYIYSNKGSSFLRPEAKEALESMGRDFYNTFGTNIGIASSYRSYDYQKGIKDNGCSDALCAHPGHSEHQSGLAVDLFEASTENDFLKKSNLKNYYWWLGKNAHKYGFHNSYQKGKKIDGYVKEPWHWRYVGVELATFLHDNNITFAEYYYALHTDTK